MNSGWPLEFSVTQTSARRSSWNRSPGDFRIIQIFSGHPGVIGGFVVIITRPARARDGTYGAKKCFWQSSGIHRTVVTYVTIVCFYGGDGSGGRSNHTAQSFFKPPGRSRHICGAAWDRIHTWSYTLLKSRIYTTLLIHTILLLLHVCMRVYSCVCERV